MNTKKTLIVICLMAALCGCRSFSLDGPAPFADGQVAVANPLPVAPVDRQVVMDQVSDELDNYFRIRREERVRLVDGLMTEGWIETHPQIGATYLEPWRRDSAPGFERAHSTLQTVRRFAKTRIIPTADGYLIDLKVFKELEDRADPEHSPISSRQFRHDNSLDIDREELLLIQPNLDWIPQGRDVTLEQQILRNIAERLRKCSEGQ